MCVCVCECVCVCVCMCGVCSVCVFVSVLLFQLVVFVVLFFHSIPIIFIFIPFFLQLQIACSTQPKQSLRSLSHHASAAYIVSLCSSGFGLLSNHHLSQAIKLYNSSCATNMVYAHQMSPRNSNLATSIIHISDECLAWTCTLSSDCSRPSGTSLINAEVMWWHITSAFGMYW